MRVRFGLLDVWVSWMNAFFSWLCISSLVLKYSLLWAIDYCIVSS